MFGADVITVGVFAGVVLALTRPMGKWMYAVYETSEPPLSRVLGPVERGIYRVMGVNAQREQSWRAYLASLLIFSLVSGLLSFLVLLAQGFLPLNPQKLPGVEPILAFNTAVSFTTNTNWQAYAGESTMSHLSQMLALTPQNFVSAAVGLCVAMALSRGLTRRPGPDASHSLGNFWQDLVRGTLYLLLPLSLVVALVMVSQGVIQNLSEALSLRTLEGASQSLAMGPVASQEAIKMLGTNGGGFFNANSAHPFENPTLLMNFLQMVLIFLMPAGITWTYGKMSGDTRQGWAIFGAMSLLFVAGVSLAIWAEHQPNPALMTQGLAQVLDHSAGNLEGKETRFGTTVTALFATVTTDASCGAVNGMHASFNPLGGLVPLVNMHMGEVIFGGVGAGLYGMLICVLLTVFLAGLMVGRTPEYLGKKIEVREMKLLTLYILIFPATALVLTGAAAVIPAANASVLNPGSHGLSEMLYAATSASANNGSAFAGLNANTLFWNVLLGLAMVVGRFGMIAPVLALAGSMVDKKVLPPGPGTFPTHGLLFTGLLTAVVVIVGALTFFPVLMLGPVVEHFQALSLLLGGEVHGS